MEYSCSQDGENDETLQESILIYVVRDDIFPAEEEDSSCKVHSTKVKGQITKNLEKQVPHEVSSREEDSEGLLLCILPLKSQKMISAKLSRN